MDELSAVTGRFYQGNEELFGTKAGKRVLSIVS